MIASIAVVIVLASTQLQEQQNIEESASTLDLVNAEFKVEQPKGKIDVPITPGRISFYCTLRCGRNAQPTQVTLRFSESPGEGEYKDVILAKRALQTTRFLNYVIAEFTAINFAGLSLTVETLDEEELLIAYTPGLIGSATGAMTMAVSRPGLFVIHKDGSVDRLRRPEITFRFY